MALKFKIYKSNRTGKTKDKYYARALHDETVDTNALAEIMQANCTVKSSDILAVLRELTETMTRELQSSKRVKLNGFGTFKLGISTTPADTADDFHANANISGVHVLFQPELTVDANGVRHLKLIDGVKMQEATVYDIDKQAAGN